jgi:chemotaxis protein methyltransferase CheR
MAFTYFFRDRQTLDLIQEYVVPAIKTRRYIRIWDAGCAIGAEPYSLAILMKEKMGQFIFRNVRILATDIDSNNYFGKTIANGIYHREEVRRIPKPIFEKSFSPLEGKPDHFIISEGLRKCVEYLKHDLLSLQAPRSGFSLVVCKNVLLHFKVEERIKVIEMFHGSLEQGGFLVVERTQKLPEELDHKFQSLVTNAQLFRKL